MADYRKIADLILPGVDKTPDYYEALYPPRELPKKAEVTRFAPSPTGFLHIGGLFASLVGERLAHQTNGVFYLRIEDTDKKREVKDGVTGIVNGLKAFGVAFDEGAAGIGSKEGAYGPYLQSERVPIYKAYAKDLVLRGLAYPCFCTEEELSAVREKQEEKKLLPGYYGEFAVCRSLSEEEIEEKVRAGVPYVVRLRSRGSPDGKIKFTDRIKGEIEMPENITDVVILKSDGVPTYHFAHAVDDTLMRTTTVVRGDEWISSVPVHFELFSAIGKRCPGYAHISPIMKESEDGGKRKISKRKDPEAAVDYFIEEGFPKEAVLEYLLNLANSSFEDWRRQNPKAPVSDFQFQIKKMSPSGALFDLIKLADVSKATISQYTAEEVFDRVLGWAAGRDMELYTLLSNDRDYALGIFSIDRGGSKPRKDISKWSEVRNYVSYFYDGLFDRAYDMPELPKSDIAAVLSRYRGIFDASDDKDAWFGKIKGLCEPFGYASDVKTYKADPGSFRGHIGDISNIIRVALTGRRQTPDLYFISRLLGKDRVSARIDMFLDSIGEGCSKK